MKKEIDEYIRLYSMDLTRLCMSLCGNTHDAEDLFQDTWVKVMKGIDSYKDEMPFDKWLFSICVNTYKNKVKQFYNRKRIKFATEEDMQTFFNSIPDIQEDDRESYELLYRAVERLPKKLKAVVALYYFKEYSAKEVAEILGIPEGTVKSRLYCAREQIKRRLNCE